MVFRGSILREDAPAQVESLVAYLEQLWTEATRDSGVCMAAVDTACSLSSFAKEIPSKSYTFMILLLKCHANAVGSTPKSERLTQKILEHLQVVADAEQIPLERMLHHHRARMLNEVGMSIHSFELHPWS